MSEYKKGVNPRQFEMSVADFYKKKGYQVELTKYVCDGGVDLFIRKGKKKIAVQVKMFTYRKVNRKIIMELYGAMAYFNCNSAECVIPLDGLILADALAVAAKLGVKIVRVGAPEKNLFSSLSDHENSDSLSDDDFSFYKIWEKFIMPLKGITLKFGDKLKHNTIVDVNWDGVERIATNGKKGKIEIEVFQYAYNKLLENGSVSRFEIDQENNVRVSSGVILILSQIPFVELVKIENKLTLTLKTTHHHKPATQSLK